VYIRECSKADKIRNDKTRPEYFFSIRDEIEENKPNGKIMLKE
jgi:hypothetical protein